MAIGITFTDPDAGNSSGNLSVVRSDWRWSVVDSMLARDIQMPLKMFASYLHADSKPETRSALLLVGESIYEWLGLTIAPPISTVW